MGGGRGGDEDSRNITHPSSRSAIFPRVVQALVCSFFFIMNSVQPRDSPGQHNTLTYPVSPSRLLLSSPCLSSWYCNSWDSPSHLPFLYSVTASPSLDGNSLNIISIFDAGYCWSLSTVHILFLSSFILSFPNFPFVLQWIFFYNQSLSSLTYLILLLSSSPLVSSHSSLQKP